MYFDSPIGVLAIRFESSAVCALNFLHQPVSKGEARRQIMTALMREVCAQLQGYFSSSTRPFSIPVRLKGTDFQQRVWRALQQIPAGEVRTYGQLAQQLHSSARAVGNACRHNPVPIIVPCHRVVSAGGLGGFCGRTDGAEVGLKRWLLKHEGVELPVLGAA